ELEEARLRSEIGRANPVFGAIRSPTLPTLDEVQHAMADDEALLCFQVAPRLNLDLDRRAVDHGSWVWVIRRDDVTALPIPDREELFPAVSVYLGLFDRRDGSEAASSARLHHSLLEPALAKLPGSVSRLILVPDGILHRLPFDALAPQATGAPLALR